MNQLSKSALALSLLLSACAVNAQSPESKPATQNIVTVSFNDVVLHTTEAQKALAALETQFAPRQAQLQALNAEVEALQKKIQGADDQASDPEKAARAEALDKKEK